MHGPSEHDPTPDDLRRWRSHLRLERGAAALYRTMAAAERDPRRAEIFAELAAVEDEHARTWERKLQAAGADPGPDRPSRGTSLLAWLGRRLGNRFLLPVMQARERRADAGYAGRADAEAAVMAREERVHAEVFRLMDGAQPRSIAQHESWHRHSTSGSLRAAVFGVNDGLVSNLSLVMGVTGAAAAPGTVLLTGCAGMLAGAFSMAAGEYVSMKSQREMFEREIAQEREELRVSPEEEMRELELIYRAKGFAKEEARRLAQTIAADPEASLDTLAREELGLDPDELGSPWGAAGSSFVSFVGGAVVPILPYFLASGPSAVRLSLALSAAALFVVGALLSLFTGRSPLFSGARMLAIGAAAAAITWSVGRLVGVELN